MKKNMFDFPSRTPRTESIENWTKSFRRRVDQRKIISQARNKWIVQGDSKLGDSYPQYTVTIVGASDYQCSCYSNEYGDARRRKMCSHVGAVVLQREREGLNGADVIEFSQRTDQGDDNADTRDREYSREPLPSNRTFTNSQISSPTASQLPLDLSSRRLLAGLPPKFSALRPQQALAVQKILSQFDAGQKIVFLDGPTGSGKSLIAEVVRRELRVRGIYLTTTKQLQDQIVNDFDYAIDLRGRRNYPTLNYPQAFNARWPANVTCDDCDRTPQTYEDESGETKSGWTCSFCNPTWKCPYQIAKERAVRGELVVTNTAYWLTEVNKGRGEFSQWPLVIIDECDTLESVLMGQVEVSISARRQRLMDIAPPTKKTVESSWPSWFDDEAIPKVTQYIRSMPKDNSSLQVQRERKGLEELRQRLLMARKNIDQLVYVYDADKRGQAKSQGPITFKPVVVNTFGKNMVWNHAQRFLLMSATLISDDQMASDLGAEYIPRGLVTMKSNFPPERRPIRLLPFANMTNKGITDQWPKMVKGLMALLRYHKDESTLIHSVSYPLTQYLARGLQDTGRQIFTYEAADEREKILDKFKGSDNGVLIAPSMERGVDLPDDLCRVVIIAKCAYPNLGDQRVLKRRYNTRDGSVWYMLDTLRNIVQSSGRAMRHEDDECKIYICDEQIWNFLESGSRWKKYVPEWFAEAVQYNGPWAKDIKKIMESVA